MSVDGAMLLRLAYIGLVVTVTYTAIWLMSREADRWKI